ncbi:MAG: N-acetylmuramoyl-L-alanine amidase [Alphaproteobacteria bacterium]
MTRIFLLALCLALAAPAAVPAAWAQPLVGKVRIGVHPDKTRFVMELSEAPRYRIFVLPDPFRVVIDLPELRWAPGQGDQKGGLIADMRFGLFAPGTSRVVLDLSAPARVKRVFVLPPKDNYPYRLVVDVVPVSRANFLAARAAPIVSDPPLAPTTSAFTAPPRPKADERPTIVIDPGHGGVDPGSRSLTGVDEKKIALDYARTLKRKLEAGGRYRVVLTRDKDIFLRLRDRVVFAEHMEGDLFVSLHANNHVSSNIRGASVYTLSEKASDAEAEALAAKENKADIISGINLGDQTEVVSKILIDLAQRETMNLSKQFANGLVGELGKVTKLLGNTHRSAGFAVLKSATVPSILIEVGYLSNKTEERLLRSKKHRNGVSRAIGAAIDAYFERQTSLNRT